MIENLQVAPIALLMLNAEKRQLVNLFESGAQSSQILLDHD
jgi:hypothetical protein